jgi:hypothetical protein
VLLVTAQARAAGEVIASTTSCSRWEVTGTETWLDTARSAAADAVMTGATLAMFSRVT